MNNVEDDVFIIAIIPCPNCSHSEAVLWDFNWADEPGRDPFYSCFSCGVCRIKKDHPNSEYAMDIDAWGDPGSLAAMELATVPYEH